jgi:hypothetical protein
MESAKADIERLLRRNLFLPWVEWPSHIISRTLSGPAGARRSRTRGDPHLAVRECCGERRQSPSVCPAGDQLAVLMGRSIRAAS